MDTVILEQLHPQRMVVCRQVHTTHVDCGPVCNLKLEKGQGEEFIAMLNPVVWSKGMRPEDCSGNTFKLL